MSLKMQMESNGRRRFLKGLAMAGGAAAVAAATGTAVAAPEAAPVSKPETAKGYHVTPHIRTYYQKARI